MGSWHDGKKQRTVTNRRAEEKLAYKRGRRAVGVKKGGKYGVVVNPRVDSVRRIG